MHGTELLLGVNLMQELLLGNSNKLILDQNSVSLVAGLSFLPELVIRALAAVTVIFSWPGGDNVQVGPHIESVNHNIMVTLPWHHGGSTLSCSRNGRIHVNFGNPSVYLQKLGGISFSFLVVIATSFRTSSMIDHHRLEDALLLSCFVPHSEMC